MKEISKKDVEAFAKAGAKGFLEYNKKHGGPASDEILKDLFYLVQDAYRKGFVDGANFEAKRGT